MPPVRRTQDWVDRFGSTHRELSATVPATTTSIPRTDGPLETGWAKCIAAGGEDAARACGDMAVAALAQPNPIISESPEGSPDFRLYTWVIESPEARHVLLWVNSIFDHTNVSSMEMTRLSGSDLWTITLRMPADWRATYSVCVWESDDTPPWRVSSDRRDIRQAAMSSGSPDPRGMRRHRGVSIVEGPNAPVDRWRSTAEGANVDTHELHGTRFWVYSPSGVSGETPLLLLFDGQQWVEQLDLPGTLEQAISSGEMPPVHVVMIDSGDVDHRWDNVGVPGGQVDFIIDELLGYVRERYDVSPRGDRTIVSGVSFGGLASLWTLSLSGGEVGHAIAQSPSLWRFDVAESLSSAEEWSSILVQSGRLEGQMLTYAHQLAEDLSGDIRPVKVESIQGGHDWAWWRVSLLSALTSTLNGMAD